MTKTEATFSLLDEEERDEFGPGTPIIKGRPSLRSISLSQAPSAPRDLESSHTNGNSLTSCAELHRLPAGSTTSLTSQQAKNTKKVNKFYKKQNELLENFKNDSEQIEQFNRTRRRTTSKEDDESSDLTTFLPPNVPEEKAITAPLVKHVCVASCRHALSRLRLVAHMLTCSDAQTLREDKRALSHCLRLHSDGGAMDDITVSFYDQIKKNRIKYVEQNIFESKLPAMPSLCQLFTFLATAMALLAVTVSAGQEDNFYK
uniref:Uncharacterized protein n=1 Tax=Caenorhabditis japonica TaxID=281687 RepID=A0A8R1IIF6_CAEJA